MEVDLVLLAMGFLGPERNGMLSQLGVKLTDRGNVWRDGNWMTSVPGVFTSGDMQRGQSLVVWAIAEDRIPFALRRRGVFAPSRSASGARPNGFHLDLTSMVYVGLFVAARIGLCGKATGRGVSDCF